MESSCAEVMARGEVKRGFVPWGRGVPGEDGHLALYVGIYDGIGGGRHGLRGDGCSIHRFFSSSLILKSAPPLCSLAIYYLQAQSSLRETYLLLF